MKQNSKILYIKIPNPILLAADFTDSYCHSRISKFVCFFVALPRNINSEPGSHALLLSSCPSSMSLMALLQHAPNSPTWNYLGPLLLMTRKSCKEACHELFLDRHTLAATILLPSMYHSARCTAHIDKGSASSSPKRPGANSTVCQRIDRLARKRRATRYHTYLR